MKSNFEQPKQIKTGMSAQGVEFINTLEQRKDEDTNNKEEIVSDDVDRIEVYKLIHKLQEEGYKQFRVGIQGRGLVGLRRFLFTTGLCYGLTEESLEGRYCYENYADALKAMNEWDGIGDPKDDLWIKHKGLAGEYSNPNKE